MKKWSIVLVAASLAVAGAALASPDVGVGININVGAPPPVPVPVPGSFPVIVEPPEFVMPSPLGFFVAVGVPYDLCYIRGSYYLYRGGHWYRGRGYSGPWVEVKYRSLPPGLRKHRVERIRSYRDEGYRAYGHDRDRYRDRWYRPGKAQVRQERRIEREERKEDRRIDREQRREDRRMERVERKEERRIDREERRHGRD